MDKIHKAQCAEAERQVLCNARRADNGRLPNV